MQSTSGAENDSDESADSLPNAPKRTKKADNNVCELLDHVMVHNTKCAGVAQRTWAAYVEQKPKRDLTGLGCAYDDPGWNWCHEMGPQKLKRAICERQNEADDAALDNMTDCMTKSFGGPEESAIQMAGPTSLCSSNEGLTLKIPCGHPLHKDANLLFQPDKCMNLPVDIQGTDVREFREVCWECYRAHETRNPTGPECPVHSPHYFKRCCRHSRFCKQEDQSPGPARAKTVRQHGVRDLGALYEQ